MQSFMKRKIKINFVLICTALEKNIDCLMKRLFRQKVIINISACSHPSQFSIIQSIRSIQFCNFSFTMKSTFFLRNGVFPSLSSHSYEFTPNHFTSILYISLENNFIYMYILVWYSFIRLNFFSNFSEHIDFCCFGVCLANQHEYEKIQ